MFVILGTIDFFILGLFIFIAVIFLSMGVKVRRGKLDRSIHNRGLNVYPGEAIKKYGVEQLRKRNSLKLLALAAIFFFCASTVLLGIILIGLTVASVVLVTVMVSIKVNAA